MLISAYATAECKNFQMFLCIGYYVSTQNVFSVFNLINHYLLTCNNLYETFCVVMDDMYSNDNYDIQIT